MSRGRVVMLVDNSVHNDSRVQKQARSAAEHGWDVTLIGRSPTPKPQRFTLGAAKVRLIPVENTLPVRRYQLRSGLLRGSLSYRTKRLARYRQRQVEAKAHDARMQRLLRQQQAEAGARGPASSLVVVAPARRRRSGWPGGGPLGGHAGRGDRAAGRAGSRLTGSAGQAWTGCSTPPRGTGRGG